MNHPPTLTPQGSQQGDLLIPPPASAGCCERTRTHR
nr:MAG TPA: hypothetical protein [Caudoviricetes sp.]